jgi:hypothetical protein
VEREDEEDEGKGDDVRREEARKEIKNTHRGEMG